MASLNSETYIDWLAIAYRRHPDLGTSALSLPCGFTADRTCRSGLQMAGPLHGEDRLCSVIRPQHWRPIWRLDLGPIDPRPR